MKNTAIIIPARLGAKRFPNKPLAKINNVANDNSCSLIEQKNHKLEKFLLLHQMMKFLKLLKRMEVKPILTKSKSLFRQ